MQKFANFVQCVSLTVGKQESILHFRKSELPLPESWKRFHSENHDPI